MGERSARRPDPDPDHSCGTVTLHHHGTYIQKPDQKSKSKPNAGEELGRAAVDFGPNVDASRITSEQSVAVRGCVRCAAWGVSVGGDSPLLLRVTYLPFAFSHTLIN